MIQSLYKNKQSDKIYFLINFKYYILKFRTFVKTQCLGDSSSQLRKFQWTYGGAHEQKSSEIIKKGENSDSLSSQQSKVTQRSFSCYHSRYTLCQLLTAQLQNAIRLSFSQQSLLFMWFYDIRALPFNCRWTHGVMVGIYDVIFSLR